MCGTDAGAIYPDATGEDGGTTPLIYRSQYCSDCRADRFWQSLLLFSCLCSTYRCLSGSLSQRRTSVVKPVQWSNVMSKLMTMREAIARYVPDGASVALGLALEPCIPFAAGHEIIRQSRRDLTLIGPISD